MKEFIFDDDVDFEWKKITLDKSAHELFRKSQENYTKRLNLEKLPLEPFIPSYSAYKTQAHFLQSSLQLHRDTLINHNDVSYDACLNIISNIYGFKNWHIFQSTFEEYSIKIDSVDNVDSFIPSYPSYNALAHSLKSALQKYKEDLIKQNKISYGSCLDIVSNIYGFANKHLLKITFNGHTNKDYIENFIKYIQYKFYTFLYEFNENSEFFKEEYLGNKDDFISKLSKLSKKNKKLFKILSDDKAINNDDIVSVIDMVKNCCYFYFSINKSKLDNFLDDLWSSRDMDLISKFDPISFGLEALDKLEFILESVNAPYSIICLIKSTRILEKNKRLEKYNQSFQQISNIINIMGFCLSTFQTESFRSFNKDKELREKFNFNIALLNIQEIAERYHLQETELIDHQLNPAVEKSKFLSFDQARKYAQSLKISGKEEYAKWLKTTDRPKNIPSLPSSTYKYNGWLGWGDYLGTGVIANQNLDFLSFEQARKYVQNLKITGREEYVKWSKTTDRPKNIPASPSIIYKNNGWISWGEWLGSTAVDNKD